MNASRADGATVTVMAERKTADIDRQSVPFPFLYPAYLLLLPLLLLLLLLLLGLMMMVMMIGGGVGVRE